MPGTLEDSVDKDFRREAIAARPKGNLLLEETIAQRTQP
ncbi:hypothetical protein S7335_704 [Synechococcus sp. PCC 7335]|nr:hypothetical protein S7335_704 [Synechococcus sp. PCC 7335]